MTNPEDDEQPWREEQGLEIREQARSAFEASKTEPDLREAERLARSALALAYSALNWLEDTRFEDEVHEELHYMARVTRDRFARGCRFVWTGSQYEHRCPVALAHKRFGFSPGMVVGKRECSICGDDVSECPHLRNRTYQVPGGPGPSGYCPVCHQKECEHTSDVTYDVRPASIIKEIIRLDEVSLVSRPVNPSARLLAIPVNGQELRRNLGPRFRYGVDTVDCSQCRLPCPGFSPLKGDPRLEPSHRAHRTLSDTA